MTARQMQTDAKTRLLGLAAAIVMLVMLACVFAMLARGGPIGLGQGAPSPALVVELLPLAPEHGTVPPSLSQALPPPRVLQRHRWRSKPEPVAASQAAAPTTPLPAMAGGPGMAQSNELPADAIAAYRLKLESHLAAVRIYPPAARAAGEQGQVSVHFVLQRNGKVREAWIGVSSGIGVLDREALDAIGRAQPLPLPPPNWPEAIEISLPISFRLG